MELIEGIEKSKINIKERETSDGENFRTAGRSRRPEKERLFLGCSCGQDRGFNSLIPCMVDSGEVSIGQYTRDIWDQGPEPICICVAGADMVTTMYRMLGLQHLELSPKILIDARCSSIADLEAILTNPELGLQSIRDYPFMFPRFPRQKIEYQQGNRFWIDKLVNYFDKPKFKDVIRENYSENGKKVPLLASVVMGDFRHFDVSLDAFVTPFRHNMSDQLYVESLRKQDPHTLLIVGANFSLQDESEHYCLVKNCYSEEWGQKGFSKIALDMVEILTKPVLEKEHISYVGWKEERTWAAGPPGNEFAAGKITLNRRVSGQQAGQTDTHDEITKMKRSILVSNLRLHTLKSDIYEYFNGILRAKVTDISFNSYDDKYYNKSCLVTFSSIETAKKVRKIRSHQIQGVEVTVERYRGKGKHQNLFRRGEHDLFIEGINEVSILHRLCEDIALRCGPHSGIDFRRDKDDGQHNGEVVISFYEETHRQMALDIITREFKCDATLLKSVDQVNQD